MRRFFVQLALLLAPLVTVAEERFPPPEFSAGYSFPPTTTPPPRAEWFAYLDIALLAIALGLASYLALKKRSRVGLILLMLFSLAYFGFYREGCVCAIGSIQNIAYALGHEGYALPLAVAAFFVLPLLTALFAGRSFCAAVCPHGALQDLVLLRPVKIPSWLEHALGVIPFMYLGVVVLFAATGSLFVICEYDPFIAIFRRSGSMDALLYSGAFLAIAMVVGRPYCRFLCPYGALLRIVAPLSKWHVTINPPAKPCINCRLCEVACPYGAIAQPTPEANAGSRREDKRRLALLLTVLPVLVLMAGWLGSYGSAVLAEVHPTARLADRIWLEEHHRVTGTTPASAGFRRLGRDSKELYREAAELRVRYIWGGWLLGGWFGLVIGGKLVVLSLRRRRTEYTALPSTCVACGRCYANCPLALPQVAETGETIDEDTTEPAGRS